MIRQVEQFQGLAVLGDAWVAAASVFVQRANWFRFRAIACRSFARHGTPTDCACPASFSAADGR